MSKLLSLKVENLALIAEAEIELCPGLNVLSGETGAGKTMLAKALEALLGAKITKGVVRPGAEAAYIEAVFSAPENLGGAEEIAELLDDLLGEEIVLARRITSSGRSRCLINGRTVSVETLREIASQLIAFYGQHEGRKLMVEQAQTSMLDRSGDSKGTLLLEKYRVARGQSRSAANQLKALKSAQQDRQLDLVRFELKELEDLNPKIAEEQQLMEELGLLAGATEGQQACWSAYQLLDSDKAACSQVLESARALESAGNPTKTIRERLESAYTELCDLASELQSLSHSWKADPHRQSEVETRLSDYARLSRKHTTIADQLIVVQNQLMEKILEADQVPLLIEEAEIQAAKAFQNALSAGTKLSKWRQSQAPKLSKAVGSVLQELAMEAAIFEVRLEPLLEKDLPEYGLEAVVFYLQANPGLPAEPISQVASGGEVSRLMLALVSETGLEDQAVLVLDEPDAGIGGQTAHGVASRLVSLSKRTQLLVISHLPQIAARADRHFRLNKTTDGHSTETTIEVLSSQQEIIDQLCLMAGHDPSDSDARKAAQKML